MDDIGLENQRKQRDSERLFEPEVKPEAFSTDSLLISNAKNSLRNSRQAVEKLLDSIPRDDHYSMGILGPILAALRDAERDIGRPSNQVSQATGPKSQQSSLNEPNAPRGF